MSKERKPSKPPPKISPGEKGAPERRGKPYTVPSAKPKLEPPRPWPRKS